MSFWSSEWSFQKSISLLGIAACLIAARLASQTPSAADRVDEMLRSMQEIGADDDLAIKRSSADRDALLALKEIESILGSDSKPGDLTKARDVLRHLKEEPSADARSRDVAAAVAAADQLLTQPSDGIRERIHHAATDVVAERVRSNVKNLTMRLFEAQRLCDGADTNVSRLQYGLVGAN